LPHANGLAGDFEGDGVAGAAAGVGHLTHSAAS
jgi:hypothetical protein